MEDTAASTWVRAVPEPSRVPPLRAGAVHVWRVGLGDPDVARAMRPLLSPEERARADRFFRDEHRVRFTVAHGWKRRILAAYAGLPPHALRFDLGPHGKPSLAAEGVQFNLSHSADLALVAVAGAGPVGVDVEQWSEEVEHLEICDRFFSEAEQTALRRLAGSPRDVVAGFFAAWSRKEAYIKATGVGIARGLDHFDVSLTPGEPARLLRDARDPTAPERWTMTALDAGDGYSAALVATAPVDEVLLFEP